MTPLEILEDVKSRFIVLYHQDEARLLRLLRQSLGKFQEKAGAIAEIWTENDSIDLPTNYLAFASACDSQRRYIPIRIEKSLSEPIIFQKTAATLRRFVFITFLIYEIGRLRNPFHPAQNRLLGITLKR